MRSVHWLVLLLYACSVAGAATQATNCTLRTGFDASHTGVVPSAQYWQPTFATYLNQMVGARLNCTFDIKIIDTIDGLYDAVQSGSVDFVLTDVSIRECLETEFSVSAMVTLVNLVGGAESVVYGGSILVKADRTDMNTVRDIVRKKLVAGSSPALAAGCQMQWDEVHNSGVNIFTDTMQVNFAPFSQMAILDVLSGAADVAFARSDLLWKMVANGTVNASDIKVLSARTYHNYPYPISTQLFPEWAVGALPHVPVDIRTEVATALMRMNASNPAAQLAGYSRWTSPFSYMQMHYLQQRIEYVSPAGKCLRSTDSYGAITCPPGFAKRPEATAVTPEGCAGEGLLCPQGYTCICNPCIKLPPVKSPYILGMRAYILGIVAFLVLVVAGLLAFLWLRKHSTIVPHIPFVELGLTGNKEILDQDEYGPVLRGVYRGTAVAVRRILPHGALKHLLHSADCHETVFGCQEYEMWLSTQLVLRRRSTMFGGSCASPSGSTATLLSQAFQESLGPGLSPGVSPGGSLELPINRADLAPAQPPAWQSCWPAWCSNGMAAVVGCIRTGCVPVWRGLAGLAQSMARPRRRVLRQALLDAQAAIQLRHPNIIAALGISSEPCTGDLLLVESWPEHGVLSDFLRNNTVDLELDMMLSILRDVVAGMRNVHSSIPPILNPNLCTETVMLDETYRAQLLNWPLHRRSASPQDDVNHLLWMAPELLQGGRPTPASDVYAFGIFMYEVLARRPPYEGEDPTEVAQLIMEPLGLVDKRPIMPTNAGVDPGLNELMQHCWVADPAERPPFSRIEWRLHKITQGAGCLPGKLLSRKNEKSLLDQMLPPKVAAALREGRPVEPETYECVTIFFSDIVGFTDISGALLPHQVMAMLDRLYKQFDALTTKYDLFKVETIGDAYMVVSNLRHTQADHAMRIAEFALDAVATANCTPVHADRPDSPLLHIRCGFHSGPVVASVVGNVNPRYCLFGDTVNTASRMESTSLPDRIHMSGAAAALLLAQAPEFAGRVTQRSRELNVKGKGAMRTFWLNAQEGPLPDPDPPSPAQPPTLSGFFDVVRKVQAHLHASEAGAVQHAQHAAARRTSLPGTDIPHSPMPALRKRLSMGSSATGDYYSFQDPGPGSSPTDAPLLHMPPNAIKASQTRRFSSPFPFARKAKSSRLLGTELASRAGDRIPAYAARDPEAMPHIRDAESGPDDEVRALTPITPHTGMGSVVGSVPTSHASSSANSFENAVRVGSVHHPHHLPPPAPSRHSMSHLLPGSAPPQL